MPMLIDAGKRCLPCVNQDENSASVGEVDCVTRDDGFEHALYAVALALNEPCRSIAGIQCRQPVAGQNQQRNALRVGILCRATIRMRMTRRG
jgi:hypothetical protein